MGRVSSRVFLLLFHQFFYADVSFIVIVIASFNFEAIDAGHETLIIKT